MIIGATAATDADVLFAAASLYTRQKLRRIYYSAYIPVEDGAPADAPPQIARERRLYQADWLIRVFGFSVGDLTPPGAESLDIAMDPKLAWALRIHGRGSSRSAAALATARAIRSHRESVGIMAGPLHFRAPTRRRP